MTSDTRPSQDERIVHSLEEICDNTRAVRRVVNRILDHLEEAEERDDGFDYDPEFFTWQDMDESDDMYY